MFCNLLNGLLILAPLFYFTEVSRMGASSFSRLALTRPYNFPVVDALAEILLQNVSNKVALKATFLVTREMADPSWPTYFQL